MEYLKLTIILSPDTQDFRDILIAGLADGGFESFVENETDIEAYIQNKDIKSEQLEYNFEPLFSIKTSTEIIPDQNWNEEWEKNYFKPLIIADKCVVRAPFHTDYPKCEYEIVIEPNMAFGTGNHETTSLMMEYILETPQIGKTVLDMGCGTGILSILSSKCGASSVTSIDIDKWSFDATSENSVYNNCPHIIAILGDVSSIPDQKYDIIYANIQKNIIISDLPLYFKAMGEDSTIFLSGFYENDLKDVSSVAQKLGLQLADKKVRNNWCCAKFIKKIN